MDVFALTACETSGPTHRRGHAQAADAITCGQPLHCKMQVLMLFPKDVPDLQQRRDYHERDVSITRAVTIGHVTAPTFTPKF
ncbi:hypothetical protein [Paracoccus sp. Ld10]|uniref:hypothetical protein n=1 Tax=Paracoccus sp. Ld10 TaxID=649158 RepID=UPI003868717A